MAAGQFSMQQINKYFSIRTFVAFSHFRCANRHRRPLQDAVATCLHMPRTDSRFYFILYFRIGTANREIEKFLSFRCCCFWSSSSSIAIHLLQN